MISEFQLCTKKYFTIGDVVVVIHEGKYANINIVRKNIFIPSIGAITRTIRRSDGMARSKLISVHRRIEFRNNNNTSMGIKYHD